MNKERVAASYWVMAHGSMAPLKHGALPTSSSSPGKTRWEGKPDWFEDKTKSLLRIDLVENADKQTLLRLIQFAPANNAVGGTAGWHHFAGERLKSFLETGEVVDNPDRFDELKALYSA